MLSSASNIKQCRLLYEFSQISYQGDMEAYIQEASKRLHELEAIGAVPPVDIQCITLLNGLSESQFLYFKQTYLHCHRDAYSWESLCESLLLLTASDRINGRRAQAVGANSCQHQNGQMRRQPSRPCKHCNGNHFDNSCTEKKISKTCRICLGPHWDGNCPELTCLACKGKGHFTLYCSNKQKSLYVPCIVSKKPKKVGCNLAVQIIVEGENSLM